MDKKQIQTYFDVEVADGCGLMPLRKWDEVGKNGKKMGKHPIPGKAWGGIGFSKGAVEQGIKDGRNLGYRIRADELIVDMDPRDYGSKSVEEVEDWVSEMLGCLDFDEVKLEYPVVKTGGGGYHIYLKMAVESGWSEQVGDWKGVEFKKTGKYVVCAGSRHPNGKLYKWCGKVRLEDRQLVNGAVAAGLGKALEKSTGSAGVYEGAGGDESWRAGVLSNEQLKAWILDPLDVEQFKAEGDWIHVVRGCHHATKGEGEEEFVEWCLGDTDYVQDESIIRDVWRRQKIGGEKSTNAWSLLGVLRGRGVLVQGSELSKWLEDAERAHTLASDFSGLEAEDEAEEEDGLDTYLTEIQEGEDSDFKDLVPPKRNEELAEKAIAGIGSGSGNEEVTAAVKAVLGMKDVLTRVDALDRIRSKRGLARGLFTDFVKGVEKETNALAKKDLPRLLAEATLQVKFYRGKGLVYTMGEQLWAYNGTHWSMATKKWVEQKLTEVLDKLKKRVKVSQKENPVITEASAILLRLCAVNRDALGLKDRPKAVVNCLNGEYWLEEGVLKPHRPESYLLQVLNIEYDDWALCPKMDALLEKTFERFEDRDEKIRFLYQMFGYIIDPCKELDKWFMFHGSGGDGKSTVINILMALLGDAVLPISIGDFDGAHTMSAVPGKLLIVDEDMDARVKLPDGTLKKLSGHTQLSCDPKHSKREYFRPACTVLLCGNTLPITDDVTEAARRRPIVMYFDNDLHKEGSGGVKGADREIIECELPGVLNMAIIGRSEIVNGGAFDVPRSCEKDTQNWIEQSNILAMFATECVQKTGNEQDVVLLVDLFDAYKRWCEASGLTKRSTKQMVRKGFQALDFRYDEKMAGGWRGFRGVKLVGPGFEES